METKKFLMITTHYPPHNLGGDAVFVKYLAEGLVGKGHDVHVIFNPSIYSILRNKRARYSLDPVSVCPTLHAVASKTPRISLAASLMFNTPTKLKERISDIVRKENPDVVHWHNTKGMIGTPFLTPNRTCLYTAHDYYSICPRSNMLLPNKVTCDLKRSCFACHILWRKPPQLWRSWRRRVLRVEKGIAVVSPSQFLAGKLSGEGVNVQYVLPNFVPDLGHSNGREIQAGSNPYLIYLGMLEAHKGPLSLLEAFAASSGDHEFRLVLMGEGSLKGRLAERIKELGLSKRVSLPGFIPQNDLVDIRMRAALQVVPSEWPENCPLTALEALSFGTPILGSNEGGLPEIIDNSGSRTYESGDVQALASELVRAWTDLESIDKKRAEARRAYETRYTCDAHLSKYFRIIERCKSA